MILERYLQREVLQSAGAALVLLVLIFASTRAVNYLGDAASGKLAGDVILAMLALKTVESLRVIVPLCYYLGVLLVLGRMQQEREVVAIANAGCGRGFFHRQMLRLGAGYAVFMALLMLVIVPMAERRIELLEARGEEQADISGIAPGRFKEFEGGDRVLYVQAIAGEQQVMRNVFLRVRERDREGVLKADGARLENDPASGERFVVFADGRRYLGMPGQADYTITEFEKYGVRLGGGRAAGAPQMGAMPTHELFALGTPHAIAELHWRVAMPVSILLLGALAVTLSGARLLGGRFMLVLVGILIYFVYNNLLGIGRSLIKREVIDTAVGLWPVHLGLLGAILALEFVPRLRRRRRPARVELLPAR